MKKLSTLLFLTMLLLLGAADAMAQLSSLEVGQIYRFESARGGRSLRANGFDDVHTKTTDLNDKAQEWYVTKDGDYYVLRNVACGKYLKGAPSAYTAWGMTDDYSANENKFQLLVSNSTLNTLKTKGSDNYGHMHDSNNGDNGGYEIVGWTNADDVAGSHWTITKVNYTAEQIKALLDAVPTAAEIAAYQPSLDALFSDAACVTPKLASLSAAQDSEAYKALPLGLQRMVDKVYGGNWEEATVAPADRPNRNNNTNHSLWTVADTWSSDYAKKFRVQMYEPYSIENEVTSYLRINAHCNMDNPTGIYANSGDVIYIMVGDDIPDGAELWLAYQSGNGAAKFYNESPNIQLHKGLNTVTFTTDGCQMWIYYLVHTYNKNGATIAEKFPENRKLSNYKPLKIHIEGGHINGFFNAIGDFRATDSGTENLWGDVDNNDDWDYYKARVALPTDFALLGHRQTLLFPFGAYDSEKGYFGVANADGGIEHALAYHLENIKVVSTPNCYAGSGNGFGNYTDTYYPGMGLSTGNGKINIMIEAWDRITYSELASMGLVSTSTMDKMNKLYPRWTNENKPAEIYNYGSATVNKVTQTYKEFCQGVDYSEYFNHHACGVGAGSGYMSGGWRVCNYHYNTMGSVIGAIANEAGPTWGPAHEIGHQHQGVFNLNGQTEVTNNFFSNVAVWYMGMGTSRVNGNDGLLESVLAAFNTENNDLYTNNIWAITHMYYRLWLYYHLAGNNTQFWPRLFELCRQVPLENGGQISGTTSLLRFYQHACDAAGEDLTEFFRAHGFFEVMDNRVVGDYSNAIYNTTQEQIDTAIKEIKAKGYPQNLAVLFINDGTAETTLKHDGSTSRSLWDNNPTADFGSVNDFIAGNVNVTSAYTATLGSDGNVTMSGGEGGVGFLILNEKGELVSFSNKSTFALGEEARHALISGAATIVSVNSDNSEPVEATIDLTFVKKEILASLIAEAQAVVEGVDDTYTKVGCYKPTAVTDLQAAIAVAEEAYANGTALEGAYEVLYAEYRKVIDNPTSVIGVISGKKYAIKSKSGNDYMTVSGSNVVTTGNSTFPSTDANLWIIETAGENYHIKHAGTQKYLQGVSDNNNVIFTVGDNAVDYKMTIVATAYSALSTAEHSGKYMNRYSSSKVATWDKTDANSQWSIILVDAVGAEELANLELLASKTRELLDKVADVEYTGDGYPLQADDPSASFYITSNATENGHEPKFLLDNSTSTFFHTVWASGSPGEAHYLQVDMGTGNEIGQFVLSYTTTGQTNVDAPKVIEVKGSNNENSSFQTIATLSSLPTTHVTPYTSGVLGNDNTKYRYLRFTVTDATGGKLGNYYYFGISEFVIKRMNYRLNGIHSDYPDATNEIVTAAIEGYEAAKLAIANGSGYGDALSQLQIAYDALYDVSLTVANAKKAELQELINATKELINSVGSITTVKNEELALQVTNASGDYYLSTNSQENATNRNISKLIDGVTNNSDSYFHTNWKNSVGADHHLLLDMGADNSLGEFTFKYTTRNNNDGIDAPRTIVVEGSNDNSGFTQIAELTGLPTGQHQTYTSAVLGDNATRYRYIRFRVTDGAGKVGNYYFFAMSEFDVTAIGSTTVTINDAYKATVTEELFVATNDKVVASEVLMNNTTSAELLDAQIAELQAAKAALEEAKAVVTVDKADLQSLYDEALLLYAKMADENGAVKEDYEPSALTNEMLTAAKTALDAAKDKLDNSNSQVEIDDAEDALQTAYDDLLEVENANVATTIDKSELNKAISDAKSLIEEINVKTDYYASVEGLGLAELGYALRNAQAIIDRYYLTQTQYNDALYTLNACLSATQDVVNADCSSENRNNLATAIDYANRLLETIADKGEGYYSTVTNLGVEELRTAIQNAQAVVDKYHTTGECASLLEQLNTCLSATQAVIDADCADRTGLTKAIENANTLLSAIAAKGEGYYSAVTDLGADELRTALQNAQEVVDKYHTTEECASLLEQLNTCYDATLAVVNADCADRTALTTAVENAEALLGAIAAKGEGYYSTVADLDVEGLNVALQNAQEVVDKYHTTEQCASLLEQLNTCYNATSAVVNADCTDRTALATAIADANALLSDIADKGDCIVALPLQATEEDNPFYVKLSAVGDGSVANMIDKNADGSANVGTYVGSAWGNDIPDYTHYVQVDLGDAIAIDELLFDYITRNSGHATERPTAIKVLGSNNGVDYADITVIDEGLATGAGERWAMETPLALDGSYRYIRFAVKSGKNSFHMSDFNLYTTLSHTLKDYYTTADMVAFAELCLVLQSAEYVATHYAVSEECETIYNALSNSYNAVQDVVDADYKERGELQNLIAATEGLIARIADVADVETPVWSAANVYCNADNSTNTSAGDGDKRGVTALFDGDVNTHLHTTYGNCAQNDDLDHYIRVDMGEGKTVKAFKFNYIGRSSNSNNDPAEIVVQACNTIDGEWVNVKTLTGLPTDGDAVTYTSPLIDMDNAYRFVRLMVTETQNNSTTSYNGVDHKFFVLSEFGFTAYSTVEIKDEYAHNMYSKPVIDAYIEKNTAIEENGYYMTEDKYNDVVASLQAAKVAIEKTLLLNEIPVKLTRDVEKPVLYKIKINRSATAVLEFDGATAEATKQVAVAGDEELGNKYQAWYFMQGTDAESNDDILIMPYWNEGAKNTTLRLGAASTGSASAAVWAVESDDATKTKQNWYITFDDGKTANDWWNIRPEGKDNYFSNNGGVANKMGFWNSSSDDGSEFKFILDDTDYSLSDAYFALYNLHQTCGGEVTYGTRIGTYSESSATEYNEVYDRAAALLEAKNATDGEYDDVRTALNEKFNALEYNAGLCRLKSANGQNDGQNYSAGKLVYVDIENKPYFENPDPDAENSSKYIWEFVPVKGGYNLRSLHTQSFVTSAAWATQVTLSELSEETEPKLLTIDFLDEEENGQVRINVVGGYPLHAQNLGSKLVGYTGDAGSASAWYIEEVNAEGVYYPYTLTSVGYGTLMLGFDAIVPDGVTAYYAERVNGTNIHMEPLDGIIPANTAVVINGLEGALEFYYSDTNNAQPANLLKGTLWKQTIEMNNGLYYILSNGNNGVGMYMPKLGDDLTRFVNRANRAYLYLEEIDESEGLQPVSFSFRGINNDGPTTDSGAVLENVEVKETIYDLQGRKLDGIARSGFYIVNGKKMLVK